jgi:hypothetical protein
MAVVNYERAWLRLKAEVLEKRSHGSAGLIELMAKLEVENTIPEGPADFDSLPLAVWPPTPEQLREAAAALEEQHGESVQPSHVLAADRPE